MQLQKDKEEPWYKNLDAPVPDITFSSSTRSGNTLMDSVGNLDVAGFVGDVVSGIFSGF